MPTSQWSDNDWETLRDRIAAGTVTPVLGAGASAAIIGTGAELASQWAADVGYRLLEPSSLPTVAQYVATTLDRAGPGEYVHVQLEDRLRSLVVADIADADDPYRVLPRHPFPVWLTTNYDDLITRALNAANKPPRVGVSRWTPPDVFFEAARYDLGDFRPTAEQPLVFHLHGRYDDPASMVITEGHYLEFLEQMAAGDGVLPPQVQQALATTSLLFLGYSFRDVNLQLALRRWKVPRTAYAVRPYPAGLDDGRRAELADYSPKYLEDVTRIRFKVYWGTASEFCAELNDMIGSGDP
jgi:SIR2-like domain